MDRENVYGKKMLFLCFSDSLYIKCDQKFNQFFSPPNIEDLAPQTKNHFYTYFYQKFKTVISDFDCTIL